jgi:hypothetical protein
MARMTKRVLKLAGAAGASNVLLTRTACEHTQYDRGELMPIRAGHCSGCNMRIPSGHLQRALGGKTIQCEHCFRSLYVEAD